MTLIIRKKEIKKIASSGVFPYGKRRFCEFMLNTEMFDMRGTKTLTMDKKIGNYNFWPFTVIKFIDNSGNSTFINATGILNAVGLKNPGLKIWIRDYYPEIRDPEKIIVSVKGQDKNEFIEMVKMLNELKIGGIEPNLTCPNDSSCRNWMKDSQAFIEILQEIYNVSEHPIFLKLSIEQDYELIAQELEKRVVAISINSIPWKEIFQKKSPLEKFGGGGISGKVSRKKMLEMIKKIRKVTKTPIVFQVWDFEDLKNIESEDIIGIGSLTLRHPFRVSKIIKEFERLQPEK